MSCTVTKHFKCDACGKEYDYTEQRGGRPDDWYYLTINGEERDFCPDCSGKVQYFAISPRQIWRHMSASEVNTLMSMSQMEAIVAGVDPADVFVGGDEE